MSFSSMQCTESNAFWASLLHLLAWLGPCRISLAERAASQCNDDLKKSTNALGVSPTPLIHDTTRAALLNLTCFAALGDTGIKIHTTTTMTASKADQELTVLLTKLYGIQEDVGAKPKTSEEEKKKKAENLQSMGKGRRGKKTGSRFLELKSSIVERLQTIHRLLEEDAARGKGSVAQGNNPKEVIAAQAQMREEIRQASDEWKELDALYKNEARKKRSKFTREELEVQETLVMRLQAEIEKCKAAQMKGYARAGGAGGRDRAAASLNTAALSALDSDTLFASNQGGGGRNGRGSKWGDNSSAVAMTDGQRQKLQMIQDRDAEFDQQIDEIGEGIQDLAEIAQMQSEEVQRQNVMLEQVSNRIDNVNEHVQNVNAKMKDKLNEVGRSSDKLCVDIMCILVAVGIAAVFYNMLKA